MQRARAESLTIGYAPCDIFTTRNRLRLLRTFVGPIIQCAINDQRPTSTCRSDTYHNTAACTWRSVELLFFAVEETDCHVYTRTRF